MGASWAYLGALCCYLVTSWPRGPQREAQGRPKGHQERPKRHPREPRRGPRGADRELKVLRRARERPKRAPDSPKKGQDRPREPSEESPRQRLNRVCKEGGLGGSFPQLFISRAKDILRFAVLPCSLSSSLLYCYTTSFCSAMFIVAPCCVVRSALPRCASLH